MVLSAADIAAAQSMLKSSFLHRLVIERSTAGAVDDHNNPTRTWAAIATVTGTVVAKTPEEVVQVNEAGAVVGTHKILLLPTDVAEADRVRHDAAACPVPADRDLPDALYEPTGIRNTAGTGINLAIEARQVTA